MEIDHTLFFGNNLRRQFGELFGNSKSLESDDVYECVDTITEHSYVEDGITFSHSQLSLFHETMFHLGCTKIIA